MYRKHLKSSHVGYIMTTFTHLLFNRTDKFMLLKIFVEDNELRHLYTNLINTHNNRVLALNHLAMMVESTAGGSNHGTCMLYMNAQRKVSLVDPLLVRSHDSGDAVCCILVLDVEWSKITMWLTDRGS